jgi:hypothetical protein
MLLAALVAEGFLGEFPRLDISSMTPNACMALASRFTRRYFVRQSKFRRPEMRIARCA